MTTSIATLVRNAIEHLRTATASTPPGSVAVSAEGNVLVYPGTRTAVTDDVIKYVSQGVFAFTKDTTAFAVGQMVYWDPVNLIPSATGFIRMGRCAGTALTGDATVSVRLFNDAQGAFQSIVAAGTALTNSTTATDLGTITLPANYLQAGDRLKIRAQAIVTAHNASDTLTAVLRIVPGTSGSAVNLATTGAVNNSANDIVFFDFEVQIRTIGVTGTMVGAGMYGDGVPGTATMKPALLASNTIDTTQTQVVGVQGTWSAANAGDSVRLDVLSVELIRA